MNTTIQFLRDPEYQDTVILFILAPAGMQFDTDEIGKNLFGSDRWSYEALLIDRLAPKTTFRYSDISFHWPDFLDLAFRHVDHGLFYVPHKHTFKEIGKESLLEQNPDLYSFSFHKYVCAARKGVVQAATEPKKGLPGRNRTNAATSSAAVPAAVPARTRGATAAPVPARSSAPLRASVSARTSVSAADKLGEARAALLSLIDAGWSGNAVATVTGITAMTISSIRNGKSTHASTRVHAALMKMKADADAGRITPAGLAKAAAPKQTAPVSKKAPPPARTAPNAAESHGLLASNFIAVDAGKLEAMIDRLSALFSEAIGDLEEIRRQLRR